MLWDVTTGQPIGTPLRQRSTAFTVAFANDGKRVATGSDDGSVRVWDIAAQTPHGQLVRHDEPIFAACFSSNGLYLLTEQEDGLQLENKTTGVKVGRPIGLSGRPPSGSWWRNSIWYAPEDSRLAVHHGGLNQLSLWDLAQDASATARLTGYPFCFVASPDGSRILGGFQEYAGHGGFAQLCDATTLERLGKPLLYPRPILAVAFSPDGSQFVTGCLNGTTQLWDAATLAPIGEPLMHHSEVKAIAQHPTEEQLLIGFADGTVRLWDLATRTPIGVPLHHQNIVSSVAFNTDGSRFLTCSLDGTAQVWDTVTQIAVGPRLKHDGWWPDGAFSPDGSQLLVTSKAEGAARLAGSSRAAQGR